MWSIVLWSRAFNNLEWFRIFLILHTWHVHLSYFWFPDKDLINQMTLFFYQLKYNFQLASAHRSQCAVSPREEENSFCKKKELLFPPLIQCKFQCKCSMTVIVLQTTKYVKGKKYSDDAGEKLKHQHSTISLYKCNDQNSLAVLKTLISR